MATKIEGVSYTTMNGNAFTAYKLADIMALAGFDPAAKWNAIRANAESGIQGIVVYEMKPKAPAAKTASGPANKGSKMSGDAAMVVEALRGKADWSVRLGKLVAGGLIGEDDARAVRLVASLEEWAAPDSVKEAPAKETKADAAAKAKAAALAKALAA
jgi:hypothetical protein